MRLAGCVLALALAVAMLAPIPAGAQGNVLRVSFDELPPWKVLDENGTPDGVEVRLLDMMADRLGLETRYVIYPFKRGLHMLEIGEVDMMPGVLRRSDREKYLHFVEPPYKNFSHKAFYVPKGEEKRISRHEDLRSLRIGTRLGESYYPRFDNDAVIEKEAVRSLDLNIKMLLAGRIDTFILTESSGDYETSRGIIPDTISKADFVYRRQQDVYIVVSKSSPFAAMIEDFNEVMAELIREGAVERIKMEFIKEAGEKANASPSMKRAE